MARNKNLLAKLDAEKGRDIEAEKRKKQVKSAEKKKREKAERKAQEAILNGELDLEPSVGVQENGVAKEADDFGGFEDEDDAESTPGAPLEQNGKAENEDEDEEEGEEDEDEDEEGSDVPLSDLSEDDRADTIPHQRLTINNTAALLSSTARIRISHPTQKLSVHNSLVSSTPTNIPDPDDDFVRENEFHRICQSAAIKARSVLRSENVPFTRPTDYFAEMVKSDEHMSRIKQKLFDEAARKKASSEAKKQRDLKKYGKQVQVAKEQERAKEKKKTLEKISDLKRKRRGTDTGKVTEDDTDLFDVGVEDDADNGRPKKRRRDHEEGRGGGRSQLTRSKRDSKYGFGGKKRFSKSGDAQSSSDMRGFSVKKMKGKTKTGAAKRPGKGRRNAAAGR